MKTFSYALLFFFILATSTIELSAFTTTFAQNKINLYESTTAQNYLATNLEDCIQEIPNLYKPLELTASNSIEITDAKLSILYSLCLALVLINLVFQIKIVFKMIHLFFQIKKEEETISVSF